MDTQARPGGAPISGRTSALLQIHLLGRFEVVRGGAPIPPQAWRRRRPADLLRLVALSPDHALSREAAIYALWPDKDPDSGANNLHRALYDLRQILGGRWVDIERGRISLRPEAWVDVDAFERAIEEGGSEGWALAVSLYRGDLAPEDAESPWIAPRRAVLRGRFAEAAYPRAVELARTGDPGAAVGLLRRLLRAAPASEEAHRLLMLLLAETGRRADALRQHDACEAALQSAGLGPPAPETRALRDAIQHGRVGVTPSRAPLDGARRAARRLLGTIDPPPLRGRNPAVLLFEALLEQGAGAMVLLGEAGVGKTRLALEAARLATARGAAVLCGSGGASPPSVPYGLFADAFRDEARSGGHPDPLAEASAPGGDGQEARRRAVFESVRSALAAIGGGRPVLLLLDDVHLADESSLNLLHYLAREARALRLILVCTCREEAVHAGTPIQMALAHLDCERLGRGVRVPRLGLAATREQVQDLLEGDAPESVVEQVYRAADGNPALTEEVVWAWRESGRAAVPSDPEAAVRSRLTRLGPAAEALLAAAAASGPRFDLDGVRSVSHLSGHDALSALETCLEARLLDEDGSGYHFHHALAREAVYRGLSPERRRALHAALADVLEAQAARPDAPPASALIAWHRRQAEQPERAVRHLLAAGHRAVEHAGLAEGRACFEAALALLDRGGAPDRAERVEVLDALGRAQLALGELSAAARTFSEAAEAGGGPAPADAEQRTRARRLAALALVASGHLEEADAEIERGLADSRAGAQEEAAGLLHLRAQVLWHEGRAAEALEAAESCAEVARRSGDADLFARGRDLAALTRTGAGRALPLPDDATTPEDRRRQDRAPEHPFDVHLALWDQDLLGNRGRAGLERNASLLLERSRQRGAAETAASALLARGTAALAGGRLDLAEASVREALDLFRQVGSALGEALAHERLGTLLTLRGLLDPGLDAIAAGVVAAERGLLRRHALVRLHAAQARNRLAAGAVYAAEDAAREASASAALHGECFGCDAAFRPELVRVALARGRLAEAETEASQLEEIARRHGGRGFGALARLSRARVLATAGRAPEALAALGEARADLVATGLDLEAARCVRLAARLGLAGGWPEAGDGETGPTLAEENA